MKFWNHTMKCPCCGKYLVSIGKSIISEILTFGSPIYNIDHLNLVCRNNDCEGWVCDYCETWHPYNTTCSVAMVRNTRNGVDHPESYSEWMAWEGK
ncbi:MAG: hypothetical protein JSW41_04830 [Candidatus Aenigmatarchaeota archaeon]|nr:MAG: hypothetical protein JSW41_04830 [Candidatus Aenigmarchaeota archaeon]